ncbi:MAG: hypothetical protein C0501_07580 [Isosphaera sp.]|nr:hypothetical protein [Isosphaera sp.]
MRRVALLGLVLVAGCGAKPDAIPPGPAEPEPVWADAGKGPATVDGLDVDVVQVGIRPQADKKYVEVIWVASTAVKRREAAFREWGQPPPKLTDSLGRDYPGLTVPFDVSIPDRWKPNDEPEIGHAFTALVQRESGKRDRGEVERGLVIDSPPGNWIRFVDSFREGIWRALYFDLPPADATEWQLRLPASAFGHIRFLDNRSQGTFAFRIDPKTVKTLKPLPAQ